VEQIFEFRLSSKEFFSGFSVDLYLTNLNNFIQVSWGI